MKTDLKKIIRETAKEFDINLKFHRYWQWECSCCYWPTKEDGYDAFVNTNTPPNWSGDYYKIVYWKENIDEGKFYKFAKTLEVQLRGMDKYEFAFNYARPYGDNSILIHNI